MRNIKYSLVLLLIALLASACGGGADSNTATSDNPSPPAPADTTAPSVTISGPTSNPTHTTSNATIVLTGSASDNVGITRVTWSNNRGGSGTATGTTSWNTGSISLQNGSNTITVQAYDAAGKFGTDTLTVTYSTGTPGDTVAPSVTITGPTNASTYPTSSGTLTLSGSASDNMGVTQVIWSNDRGGNGIAIGTTSWSASNIALQSGNNVITVRAYDAAGNSATDVLTVTYNVPDTTPPTISSTNPANGATNASINGAITVTFSETMNAASINSGTFTVSGGVTGSISVSGATATFTPSRALANTTSYTVSITGGPGGVKDAAGNALASTYTWTFTTSGQLACNSPDVLCVDDTPGSTQEYATIQQAVDVVTPGAMVLVMDGTYAGFRVATSGNPNSRIVVRAYGTAAVIDGVAPGGAEESILISNADYVTVEGFVVERRGRSGYGLAARNATPSAPMRGLVIRGNTVRDSGRTNIYMSNVADSLIENNVASGSLGTHGIYLANAGSDNTIIRGNRSYNNALDGIHLNGDLSVGGDGLHTGIIIEGNVVYQNSENGMDLDGIQDSLIQNNLVYGNQRHALRAFQVDSADGPRNLHIINNTLLATAGGGWAVKLTEDGGGHVFFNNILLSENSSTGSICVSNPNFASTNNAVVNRFSRDGETTVVDFTTWQKDGYDAGSFLATSARLFMNAAGSDYRSLPDAPTIDTGRSSLSSVSAPQTDINRVSRPQGNGFDVGSYEKTN